MELREISIKNFKALRDVTIPLSRFGCLIGENNSGKSSILQALALFFSGKNLDSSHYFDETQLIRIALTIDGIGEQDLVKLAEDHRDRINRIIKNGRLVLVRIYDTKGKSTLNYNDLTPQDNRFSIENVLELVKGQRPGPLFVNKVVEIFPELREIIDSTMDQARIKQCIQDYADSLPDDQKVDKDLAISTGIEKSIFRMLPEYIYIPAVKDLSDEIKTSESASFGKILSILLSAVEIQIPNTQKMFEELNIKLNRIQKIDGTYEDERLEEVKLIEATVQKYVCESFAEVSLNLIIPPPELKTIFSSAKIIVNDGIDGFIDTKGDGLRRAVVFSILRTYMEIKSKIGPMQYSEIKNTPDSEINNHTAPAPAFLLLFEEPEIFLHPKGQHILFDALRVFAKDHHVLISTHSPTFLGPDATETFVKLRRFKDSVISQKPFTQVQPIDLSNINSKDQFQIICFENNNAAFFANTIVLVEGDSDYLIMPHIAKVINPSWDTVKLSVHFARITGKGNIKKYRDFFRSFGSRVAVITDLDLLINGFNKIEPNKAVREVRERLLVLVDKIIEETAQHSEVDVKKSHESGELRRLWQIICERRFEFESGKCSYEDLTQSIKAFFNWQRKSDRLTVLMTSTDRQLLELKWKLFKLLRENDIYVLERGALEQYYPEFISGDDKPSRAKDFCLKIASKDAVLNCCGEQEFEDNGNFVKENEFLLIFRGIFNEL